MLLRCLAYWANLHVKYKEACVHANSTCVDETDKFAFAPIALIVRCSGKESDPKSPLPGRIDPIPQH